MNHTPGPWTIRESATHITVVGANNETIFHDDKRCPSVVEDARLIVVAPDLLAHLEFAVKLLEGISILGATAQVDAMRAVIARARGEA